MTAFSDGSAAPSPPAPRLSDLVNLSAPRIERMAAMKRSIGQVPSDSVGLDHERAGREGEGRRVEPVVDEPLGRPRRSRRWRRERTQVEDALVRHVRPQAVATGCVTSACEKVARVGQRREGGPAQIGVSERGQIRQASGMTPTKRLPWPQPPKPRSWSSSVGGRSVGPAGRCRARCSLTTTGPRPDRRRREMARSCAG